MRRAVLGGFLALMASCDGHNMVDAGFELSNGVALMAGIDAKTTTTLAGQCTIDGTSGHIECDRLVVRVDTLGVFANIGYEVIAPSAATCAGSTVPAPQLAVFSFGKLVVLQGATVSLQGANAIALVAADSMDIAGVIRADMIVPYNRGEVPDPTGTLSPGQNAMIGPTGAGGAGAATMGGGGATGAGNGGAAVPPQLEPLCFGSPGGTVVNSYPDGNGALAANGGYGGGAALLGARKISVSGSGVVSAAGYDGYSPPGASGGGGGAGGTLLLEASTIEMAPGGSVSSAGGAGGTGDRMMLQVPGGAAGGVNPPADGATMTGVFASPNGMGATDTGTLSGGGGGSAGFIRVRTSSCPSSWSGYAPVPTCEKL